MLFNGRCKCHGKEEMICVGHALPNVFKNMLISSARCDLSLLFLRLCLRWQIAFKADIIPAFPLTTCLRPCSLCHIFLEIQLSSSRRKGEAKLNSKRVPLEPLPLFTHGVNRNSQEFTVQHSQEFTVQRSQEFTV